MKRRDLENALLTLETTPLRLRREGAAGASSLLGPGGTQLAEMARTEIHLWAPAVFRLAGAEAPPARPGGGDPLARFVASRHANLRMLRRLALRQSRGAGVPAPELVELASRMAAWDLECLERLWALAPALSCPISSRPSPTAA